MDWLAAHFKWIMLVSGALTSTMVYAAIAPQAALESMFGATLEGPLAEIVVRNWGALSKLIFIGLALAFGRPYLGGQAGLSIGIDLLMVALFAAYLVRVQSG